MKKALFIDRDGTLIVEPPDEQIDSLEKLEFYPGVFNNLKRITELGDYELVIVSNQDGLGTASYPQKAFDLVQHKMLKAFKNEGIIFDDILIDKTRAQDKAPTRKPGTAMLSKYMRGDYDMAHSFVIGDRITDIELAKNLGAKGILITQKKLSKELKKKRLNSWCVLYTDNWDDIGDFVIGALRSATIRRTTAETDIHVEIKLQGKGKASIKTGLGFFDHMLTQIAKHAGCDIRIRVKGDLHVDEHHTIEDTAIALGEALNKALGNKKGIARYGFLLPMDDSLAQVAIDFSGRSWLVWNVMFNREKVGDMPGEMFYHFFKSFSDGARCNLYIKAEGNNEHHKAEAIFKALGKVIKMAVAREKGNFAIPSSKNIL
mgnify:CR=1 FL=1